ncbi:hypothetical protein [Pedobacter gandavensis]|uniref:hypothetical protein n=1 Tax=Pedobacter gandavensis TaxID=2679963 RepID=UPI00292F76A2|nr:hypothetical protein [Pedobacter gandavensis]
MKDLNILICYLISGLLVMVLIATLGAVLSRKLNFKYSYLSIFSAVLYIILAYLICKIADLKTALLVNGFLGLFDSTIGFLLSIKFQSNSGYTKEQSTNIIGLKTSIAVMVFALVFSFVGYGITLF